MFRRIFGMSMGDLERSRCRTAWVGQLPAQVSKREVLNLFTEYSPLDCKIIDKGGGNRFAFVLFADEQTRDRAIMNKRNSTIRGQQVIVNRSFNAYEGTRLGGKERYDDEFDWVIHY